MGVLAASWVVGTNQLEVELVPPQHGRARQWPLRSSVCTSPSKPNQPCHFPFSVVPIMGDWVTVTRVGETTNCAFKTCC